MSVNASNITPNPTYSIRVGQGNDTLFPAVITGGFITALLPPAPPSS